MAELYVTYLQHQTQDRPQLVVEDVEAWPQRGFKGHILPANMGRLASTFVVLPRERRL